MALHFRGSVTAKPRRSGRGSGGRKMRHIAELPRQRLLAGHSTGLYRPQAVIANSRKRTTAVLLDHLIRPPQQRLRNRDAERPGGFPVDRQVKPARLLDRQIAGLRALDDLVHV